MSLKPTPIDEKLARYITDHAGGRDDLLRQVEAETAALGEIARMQTDPSQAALLELLVRLAGARRALEIGVFTGYGSIRIARGLGEDGLLLGCEIDPDRAAGAVRNLERAGLADRVEIRVGPALETLRSLPEEPAFGFAYLDADKEGYPDYYDEILPRLEAGGLLAIDNVLMSGRVADPDRNDAGAVAVHALNDRILEDRRVDSVLVGMADGLTLVRKR